MSVKRYDVYDSGTMGETADGDYVRFEDYEKMSAELQYWRGVVRGARAELHEAGRLTNDEYAELCQDTAARDYVDRVDAIRDERDAALAMAAKRLARIREMEQIP